MGANLTHATLRVTNTSWGPELPDSHSKAHLHSASFSWDCSQFQFRCLQGSNTENSLLSPPPPPTANLVFLCGASLQDSMKEAGALLSHRRQRARCPQHQWERVQSPPHPREGPRAKAGAAGTVWRLERLRVSPSRAPPLGLTVKGLGRAKG